MTKEEAKQEIKEEIILNSEDMEYWDKYDNKWMPLQKGFKYRMKPKSDYYKEIEALRQKAKDNGMKAIITFEKI